MDLFFRTKAEEKPSLSKSTNQKDNFFETFDFFAPRD